MFNVAFSILLVALALNAESAFGTNQHLICKTVGDVFSDGTLSPASIRPQAIQGPPGKRGQTGVQGQPGIPGSKGEHGVPGLVNPQDIVNVVDEKMRAVTTEFQERIETLEAEDLEQNSTKQVTRELQERIETLERKLLEQNSTIQELFWCSGGERFHYKTKCYNLIIHTGYDVNYAKAGKLCAAKGQRPADILNAEHQSLVADHVRKKTNSIVQLWLGMSYRTSTRTLRFSNGNDVTGDVAASIRWWGGFPESPSSRNLMQIIVNPTTYGFANYRPTTSVNGVLCEK